MEWYEIAVDGGRAVKFPTRTLQTVATVTGASSTKQREQKNLQQSGAFGDVDPRTNSGVPAAADEDGSAPQQLGGIIKSGSWGWITRGGGNCLEIIALRTGQILATYEFTESRGYDNCCIRSVEEFVLPTLNYSPLQSSETSLLVVCLECFRAAGGGCSFVAIYSIEYGQVLSCMELPLHVTSAAVVSANCCRRSLLQNFDGCLAMGSEEGVILLLDLNIRKLLEAHEEGIYSSAPLDQGTTTAYTDCVTLCQIVDYNLPLAEIHRSFTQARKDNRHFGLQIEVIDTPCSVQCLLPIDLALGLAAGLEDGRLAFYDLAELQIIHIATPQNRQTVAPIVKLSYLEPLDDPRHCLYVWAMHENGENLTAIFHTLIYERRLTDNYDFYYFESFLRSTVRLQLPLEVTKSIAIGCQSVNRYQHTPLSNNSNSSFLLHNETTSSSDEDDGYCLCALSWYSTLEEKNKLLIFDLNQWYKEEMPYSIPHKKCPSYLAGYVLSGRQSALAAYLNPNTVAQFNSLQRYEEHFYPNSLSFDCVLLLDNGTLSYNWIGAQNKIINVLRASNSSIFLEPELYFREILRTRLLPQFSDLNVDSTFSQLAIVETILSVALEHNCYSLLRDCAKCWADGSFMGSNFTATTGISLSTLTDWLWKRATDIKTRCNDLSKGVFDYNGYPLDQREQKELGYLTRQLKLLGDLMSEVLATGKRYIPEKVLRNLDTQRKSIRIASEYQEVLLWLLNIGLLPVMQRRMRNSFIKDGGGDTTTTNNIQYPYEDLKELYDQKRSFFLDHDEDSISQKTGSCRLLYIDALIDRECKSDGLRECWLENGGNGLYPPPTIEAMLRVMLVPEMQFEFKCAVLLYFFLDLHMTIASGGDDDNRCTTRGHKEIVESFVKFPSVFKLNITLIKTVESFWNLDHGQFMTAVDEFISPFNNNKTYPQWLVELLIESLITQNASNYALRILETRPLLISPLHKLNTLLLNDLIADAFHFARTRHDDSSLELFFKMCLHKGKYGVIRDLALTEREGQLVQRILRTSTTHGAENLHFVYLLQKSKYIEAVSYLDELSRTKGMRSGGAGSSGVGSSIGGSNSDTPNLVLSAFNTTMAPVTQGLTDVYFRIKNKIKKKETYNRSPVPLSCQLIKQNANNLLGGIYHSSALSAHFATYYWGGEMADCGNGNCNDEHKSDATVSSSSALLSANNAPFLRKPQVETCNFGLGSEYGAANTDLSYPQPYRATEKRTLAESQLMEEDEVMIRRSGERTPMMAAAVIQPRKRRRLLGEEIVEDLGHFIQTNKTASQLTAQGFELQQQQPASVEHESTHAENSVNSNYLTQPLLSTPQRRLAAAADDGMGGIQTPKSVSASTRANSELHSILKTSQTPDRQERSLSSLRRDLHQHQYTTSHFDGDKNLRFKLPATEMGSGEGERRSVSVLERQATPRCPRPHPRIFNTTTTTSVDEAEEEEQNDDAGSEMRKDEITHKTDLLNHEDTEMMEDEMVDEVVIEVHHDRSTPPKTLGVHHRAFVSTYAAQSLRSNKEDKLEQEKRAHETGTGAVDKTEEEDEENIKDGENDKDEDDEEEDEHFYSPLSSRNTSLNTAETVNVESALHPQSLEPAVLDRNIFQTATTRVLHYRNGPQARKPLARLSAERSRSHSRSRTPENTGTALQPKQMKEKYERQQSTDKTSSDYVSATSSSFSMSTGGMSATAPASTQPDFGIKSIISLASSSEFTPRSSSSKLYPTLSKSGLEGEQNKIPTEANHDKLTECSTVVGSFTITEEEQEQELLRADETAKDKTKDVRVYKPLKTADTTLSMSSFEYTQVKSQAALSIANSLSKTDQTSSTYANTMQKMALLKAMETVEVMGLDDVLEEKDEEAQTACAANYDLGIAVQPADVAEEDVNAEDTNDDVVALYEKQRAEQEKRKAAEAAAPNESNDSCVIVLSSSESSRNTTAEGPEFDSDSAEDYEYEDRDEEVNMDEDEDEDECEEEDDNLDAENEEDEYAEDDEDEYAGDENDEHEDDYEEGEEEETEQNNAHNDNDKESNVNSSSSSIEMISEDKRNTNSSSCGKNEDFTSGQIPNEEAETEGIPHNKEKGAEEDNSSKKKYNENSSNERHKNYQTYEDDSQPKDYGSLESGESRILVEEAGDSSCGYYEELHMRETIYFAKSEDDEKEQRTKESKSDASAVTEANSIFSTRSVFLQNDAEITVEELKHSAYTATKKDAYEELSTNVYYCDAETTSESVGVVVGDDKNRELEEIDDDETASTSAKALREAKNRRNKKTEIAESQKIKSPQPPAASQISKIENDAETEVKMKNENDDFAENKPKLMGNPKNGEEGAHGEEEQEFKLDVDDGDDINDLEDSKSATESTRKPNESKEANMKREENDQNTETEVTADPDTSSAELPKALGATEMISPKSQDERQIANATEVEADADSDAETLLSTPPQSRKAHIHHRGASVPPPAAATLNTPPPPTTPTTIAAAHAQQRQRNKRGISMPPQTRAPPELESGAATPEKRVVSARRSMRANSAQPIRDELSNTARRSLRGASVPYESLKFGDGSENNTPILSGHRASAGTSAIPSPALAAKIVTRRRSALLDAINENVPLVDSPSARTRSRMRLNSGDSELDASIVSGSEAQQPKRARRTSISSSVSEQAPNTPSGGGRRTRSRMSQAAAADTSSEAGGDGDTPRASRRITRRRESGRDATHLPAQQQEQTHDDEMETEVDNDTHNVGTAEAALYSSARRLTRTQLAIMEKSAALSKNLNMTALSSSPTKTTTKRIGRRRTSRSTLQDSDDVESVSSRISNVSGAPSRRVTRSSVKDKEEIDDDIASVASSSLGSERLLKRRSKESKNSPNTTLSTIQEDEAEEPREPKRSRSTRKRLS